jgi:hypothetical protein
MHTKTTLHKRGLFSGGKLAVVRQMRRAQVLNTYRDSIPMALTGALFEESRLL